MEPVLIITDSDFTDKAAVRSFDLDLAFGDEEQDFVATFAGNQLSGGELVYIDGTEYGGIVDRFETATNSDLISYSGRTWHGMLAAKIIVPDSGSDYYQVSGEANACIGTIINRVGLGSVLTASAVSSGINIANFRFKRFQDAYSGLRDMLASVDAKLCMRREGGITYCWAEPVRLVTDEADNDLIEFEIGKNYRVLNHLVCAGEGDLADRIVEHVFADAAGNVSQTQTLFGTNEIAAYYNYTGADRSELISEGKKRLKESQSQGSLEIDVPGQGDWRVGDIIQGRDNRTGVTIQAPIVKKIVKIDSSTNWTLSVSYEAGAEMGASGGMKTSTESGGVVHYQAGDGINIDGNVIAADVTLGANTFTGEQRIVSANIDRDGELPSANALGNGLLFRDVDGEELGRIEPQRTTEGTIYNQMTAYGEDGNGNQVYNILSVGVLVDGTRFYAVSDAPAFRSAIAAPGLSADNTLTGRQTMSGEYIILKSTNINDGTTPSSDTYGDAQLQLYDSNNTYMGTICAAMLANGRQRFRLGTRRTIGGTHKYNYVDLDIDSGGNQFVNLSAPQAWRNGLGASGGIWPRSLGGSGQSGVATTTAISKVLSAASGFTLSNCYFQRWGHVAHLTVTVVTASAISENTVFAPFTVKEGYRPKSLVSMAGRDTTGFVNASGVVSCRAQVALAAGATFYVSATFLID